MLPPAGRSAVETFQAIQQSIVSSSLQCHGLPGGAVSAGGGGKREAEMPSLQQTLEGISIRSRVAMESSAVGQEQRVAAARVPDRHRLEKIRTLFKFLDREGRGSVEADHLRSLLADFNGSFGGVSGGDAGSAAVIDAAAFEAGETLDETGFAESFERATAALPQKSFEIICSSLTLLVRFAPSPPIRCALLLLQRAGRAE